MKNYNIISVILLFTIMVGLSQAGSINITNTSLSTLNSTMISPNTSIQYMNTTYSINITDNNTLTNILWYLNNTQISNQTLVNTTNTTLNTSIIYNFTGIIPLTAIVSDSLNNSVNITEDINFTQYILPALNTINPIKTIANISTIYNIKITKGSFSLKNITWDFNNNYYTNLVLNGINYQAYEFKISGSSIVNVEVCDINGYCSQSNTAINIVNNTPNSYWKIIHAQMALRLIYPNPQIMTLHFIPNNDTNPISEVILNWGDGTPHSVYTYTTAITSASYTHRYILVGNYSVSATVCDTIGNCNQQFIANITYTQNLMGSVGHTIINTNGKSNVGSSLNGVETYFITKFGSLAGKIAYYLFLGGMGLFGFLLMIWIAFLFFGELIHQVMDNMFKRK